MSCYDTCFFERYALGTLQNCLKSGYDSLVNRDRPDLQTADGKSFGIEVTRAMEESEAAAQDLLDDMSGYVKADFDASDMRRLERSGYGYGLRVGKNLGLKESLYWKMALPMKRILDSKVGKLVDGYYGDFDRMDLFVFCHDLLSEVEVKSAARRVMELQQYQERQYSFLYLSYVDKLFVCNLDSEIREDFRYSVHPISVEMRHNLFISSLEDIPE